MVDISDFIDPPEDDGEEAVEPAEDFKSLVGCLQALADAVASTNLAVVASATGDAAQATGRVQASISALKRFHEAFTALKGPEQPADD